ncbi:acyl-CoA dehydrogenase family protein [Dactylosporangium sp. CA-233914]|uniref:acyl-CoA dehydrogenase family protein n=1 Tax=Dactylosporangium sp. CA-233914 TaxID=3239934 RepID=UPI003D93F704
MTAWRILGADEHQIALRSSLVDLLDRRDVRPMPAPTAAVTDHQLWEEICNGLGLGDLASAEPDGSFAPLGLMATCFEVLGQRLAPVPALSTLALAAPAVQCCDGVEDAGGWWADLLSGRVTAAVAVPTEHLVGVRSTGRVTVSGTASHIVDGASADVLLVVADLPGHGTCLLEVDTTQPDRVQRRREATFDLTRELARITLRDAPARVIGRTDAGPELRQVLATRSIVLLAAEQLGGTAECLGMAVDHAKARYQFGRSLGSFQAVKHRLSDMYMVMELARSAVAEASRVMDAGEPDAELWATIAYRTASDSFTRVAAHALQLHGGLGFAWEHPVHLFLKRAKSSAMLLSLPAERMHRITELLGL